MDDVVKLTIDGEEVEVAKGISVLKAAEEAGFFIPTLCVQIAQVHALHCEN